jgi:hypothetical protein
VITLVTDEQEANTHKNKWVREAQKKKDRGLELELEFIYIP